MQTVVLFYLASNNTNLERKESLRNIFKKMDKNNDGELDEDELTKGFEESYKDDPGKAREEAKALLKKADVNRNGKIDYTGMC